MFKYSEKFDRLLGPMEVTCDDYTIDEDSLQFLARIVDEDTSMIPASADIIRNSNDNENTKCSTSHRSENHSMNGEKNGQSLHKCYICNEVFALETNLYNHTNSHTKEIDFECEPCSMSFSKLGDVFRHFGHVHKKEPPALKSPNMHAPAKSVKKQERFKRRCSICSKYFYYLAEHINGMHTKEISYKCSFCPKKFYYRSVLSRHTNQVHKNARLNV